MRIGTIRMGSFGLMALVLLLVIALPLWAIPDTGSTTPDETFGKALWVGDAQGLFRLNGADGVIQWADPVVNQARAVAVDGERQTVWSIGGARLFAHDFSGKLRFSTFLSSDFGEGIIGSGEMDVKRSLLAVDGEDGGIWLGFGKRLVRMNEHGQAGGVDLLTDWPITGLSHDRPGKRVWVAGRKGAMAYDATGRQLTRVAENEEVVDLAHDGQRLWLLMGSSLRILDVDGGIKVQRPLNTKGDSWLRIAGDGAGGAWILGKKRLLRVDAQGLELALLEPLVGREALESMAVDPGTGATWVASAGTLAQISPAGNVFQVVNLTDFGKGKNGITAPPVPKRIRALAFFSDLIPPTLSIDAPVDGSWSNQATLPVVLHYADSGSGVDPASLTLTVEDAPFDGICTQAEPGQSVCQPNAPWKDGPVLLVARISDRAGNRSGEIRSRFTMDTVPPEIQITSHLPGSSTNQALQSLQGVLSESATLSMNGVPVVVQSDLKFLHAVTLQEGVNRLQLQAVDRTGNLGERTLDLMLDTVAPVRPDASRIALKDLGGGVQAMLGSAGAVEAGSTVRVTNTTTGQVESVVADGNGGFFLLVTSGNGVTLTVASADAASNTSGLATFVTGEEQSIVIPPDPAEVAPPLPETGVPSFEEKISFLYSGENPIQTGVDRQAMDPLRLSVLKGKVLTRDGEPVAGVRVSVKEHPEFGQTYSRLDGQYDLAINGGGVAVLNFHKSGYLGAQRSVAAGWLGFAAVDDVALVRLDGEVTRIDLAKQDQIQMHRARVVTDDNGSRQATLMFSPGTRAEMVKPDGSTVALTQLNVRATEYTVGPNGPRAMPAPLPPASAYTYAVELSVDEALTAGAKTVQFDRPVTFYLENFRQFSVGDAVPVGYYDYDLSAWIPMDNGRVVAVLSVEGGVAALDIDGSGVAANDYALSELGITLEERRELAKLYAQQTSLWRVSLPHFSPIDANWPYLTVSDESEAPQMPAPAVPDSIVENNPELKCGSVIEPQNGSLGERIALTNVPFSLNYRSDLVQGYKGSMSIDIPVTGDILPKGVKSVGVMVSDREGHYNSFENFTSNYTRNVLVKKLPPDPQQSIKYQWNKVDSYGRAVNGRIPVNVSVGYTYDGVYGATSANSDFQQWFGQKAYRPSMTGDRRTNDIFLWQHTSVLVGDNDPFAVGMAGWMLSNHHVYNPTTRELTLGDGGRKVVNARFRDIVYSAVEGTITQSDQTQATTKHFALPFGVAMAGDGSLIIAEGDASRVVRLSPDGKITLVAGDGTRGFGGDGGLAVKATLNQPRGLAVGGDGSIYIADNWGHRIRKVSPKGIITTVAGTGQLGFSGDNGLAVNARLHYPTGIAVAKDGTLYIADTNNHRIRRISPNGIITTYAGTGVPGYDGQNYPLYAKLNLPHGVTLGTDGSLYIADTANHRIRRISPWGRSIENVAGNGQPGSNGDGNLATQAQLLWPMHVTISPEGRLYIADYGNGRVRAVDGSGKMATLVGNGIWGDGQEKGPAALADVGGLSSIAFRPDGEFYITDLQGYVYRIHNSMPGYGMNDIALVADDGSSLYRFTPQGRHLGTYHAKTGAPIFLFTYDSSGYLVKITDADGRNTLIERNGKIPLAIVSPDGQRTTLTVDGKGYLASVTNPASETYTMQYTADGLMTSFRNPRNFVTTMTYDQVGRLVREEHPTGGFWELNKVTSSTDYTASIMSALGRKSIYRTENRVNGDKWQRNTSADGQWTETITNSAQARTINQSDGTVITMTEAPDPRFGMLSPYLKNQVIRMPSGLTKTIMQDRLVGIEDWRNPFSVQSIIDVSIVNGMYSHIAYDGPRKQYTFRDAVGREKSQTLDAVGRPLVSSTPGLATMTRQYDEKGRLAGVTMGSGDAARSSQLVYGMDGFLSSSFDALGREIRFERDKTGRVIRQILADGREVRSLYDSNGNRTALFPPGRAAHWFQYDAVDQEQTYMPPGLAGMETVTVINTRWTRS